MLVSSFALALSFSSFLLMPQEIGDVQAATVQQTSCPQYTVRRGDTLSAIAVHYYTDIRTLARLNGIRNVNLIFIGQRLCVKRNTQAKIHSHVASSSLASGGLSGGTVRWYAYNTLEWSTQSQVRTEIYRAAAIYGVPANLLLAVAWQESSWNQHTISPDGGIGAMQLMPATADYINSTTGVQRDPYKLWDNLCLGAIYLHRLLNDFGGNLTQTISAYNEGGWAVKRWGIYNWSYVHSVLAFSRRFS